jgi:hypothetical protein
MINRFLSIVIIVSFIFLSFIPLKAEDYLNQAEKSTLSPEAFIWKEKIQDSKGFIFFQIRKKANFKEFFIKDGEEGSPDLSPGPPDALGGEGNLGVGEGDNPPIIEDPEIPFIISDKDSATNISNPTPTPETKNRGYIISN